MAFTTIYSFLQSRGDEISPPSGLELVTLKVAELVILADSNQNDGNSFNLQGHNTTYAATVLNGWPGLLTIVPDQIGNQVHLGTRLTTEVNITANPIAFAFNTSIGFNQTHQVWDGQWSQPYFNSDPHHLGVYGGLTLLLTLTAATLMYYVALGIDQVYIYRSSNGRLTVSPLGKTTWDSKTKSPLQRSLALAVDNTSFAQRLEDILLWKPDHDLPPIAQYNCKTLTYTSVNISSEKLSEYAEALMWALVPCVLLGFTTSVIRCYFWVR